MFHSFTKVVRFSTLYTFSKVPPGTSELRVRFTFQEKSLHLFFWLFELHSFPSNTVYVTRMRTELGNTFIYVKQTSCLI